MVMMLSTLHDLTRPQREVIELVARESYLHDTFYLTGGTLLKARGIVPRESNDLDFFSFANTDPLLFTQRLIRFHTALKNLFGANQLRMTDKGFLHTESSMIIDIIEDAIPNIEPFESYGNLKTASLPDIVAGKASALCSRDEIKDYIDIAFLTHRQNWLLQDLEIMAEKKFGLGTITEEKLLTELLSKQTLFTVSPSMFLRDADSNVTHVTRQIDHLIKNTSL